MNKFIWASALILLPAVSNAAESGQLSLGASLGFNYAGGLELRADYDISDKLDHNPIKARFGWDNYTHNNGEYAWAYNVIYAGAYYDFKKTLKLNKVHPFLGLNLGVGSASCSGANCNGQTTPEVSGIYLMGGVQYDFTSRLSAEAGFNGWSGLSIGANYKF